MKNSAMKMTRLLIASAFAFPLIAGLSGCANQAASIAPSTPTTPVTQASYPAVAGDWRFSAPGSGLSVAAGLTSQTEAVTGTATVYGCASQPETTTLTGSVTTKGALKLTSGEVAGGAVLTITGQLSADGKTAQNVSLTSSGSGCAIAATAAAQSFTGQVYAPASGNYTGTFTGSDGDATPVTATLAQGTSPGPGGAYTLSGSVSFPASPCLGTATINSATSTVTGGALSATYNATVSGAPVTITATGTADATAANITITSWVISGGECDSYSGTGALSD